ncbi:uncharacterized protein PRCAT00000570001 [Priceomyces carsonii]|nr:unnamed protein product [Priceomyces carsonii]
MTPWPSWLRRETVNLKIVSSILTGVVFFFLSSIFNFALYVLLNTTKY